MKWWRRSLVLVPTILFVCASFLLSCGGGGSSSPSTPPISLQAVAICPGPPPSPVVPPPSPTKTPTPSPTPSCAAISPGLVQTVNVNGTLQLQAQGAYGRPNSKATPTYNDVTNNASTVWYSLAPNATYPGQVTYQGNGAYFANLAGCTCVAASSGGIQSQTVTVGVGTTSCAPCPTVPTPTPSP